MATALKSGSLLDRAAARDAPGALSIERYGAIGMAAAAAFLLLGTAVDWTSLWILQRQPSPQWEFVAVGSTLEGFTRPVLGLAFAFCALVFGRVARVWAYRLVAGLMLLFGLAAAALAAIMVSDYFILSELARDQPQVLGVFRSNTIEAVATGGLCFLLLVPGGLLAMRAIRR